MRTVYIDLTNEGKCRQNSIYVGHTGEHNATELILAIPQAMAEECDYLKVVFLSDGRMIRSDRITENHEDGKPYLSDNQIHIYLSRYLTKNPTLGLQVEGYHIDENGSPTVISKTSFIPSLHFHLSPKGEPDYFAAVDTDELSALIEWWKNFPESDESEPDGIAKYDSYTSLPDDAENGDVAYVLNEHREIISDISEMDGSSFFVKLKDNLDRDILSRLPQPPNETENESTSRYIPTYFFNENIEVLCQLDLIYNESCGSVFKFYNFPCNSAVENYTPSNIRESLSYIYCCSDGNIANLFEEGEIDPAFTNVRKGWYVLKKANRNYRIENGAVTHDEKYTIESITQDAIDELNTLKILTFAVIDFNYMSLTDQIVPVLQDCFEIYSDNCHPAGLYVFKDNEWKPINLTKPITVSDRTQLPKYAEEDQLGIVKNNSYVFRENFGSLYVGGIYDQLFINPVLGPDAFLCDCKIKAKYLTMDPNTYSAQFLEQSTGFDLFVSAQEGLAIFTYNSMPTQTYTQNYLYSRDSGDITIPADSPLGNSAAVTVNVQAGWNMVFGSGQLFLIAQIDPFTNLPKLDFKSDGSQYRYEIMEMTCEVTTQPYISSSPYVSNDEAKGIWCYSGGQWRSIN